MKNLLNRPDGQGISRTKVTALAGAILTIYYAIGPRLGWPVPELTAEETTAVLGAIGCALAYFLRK
jgi:hypothetical protein